MRVEGFGLFSESCTTARALVEDLKTQTTSGVEALWKYSHYKESKSHHCSKPVILFYSFIPPSASYTANTSTALKDPEDLSNLNFCAGV